MSLRGCREQRVTIINAWSRSHGRLIARCQSPGHGGLTSKANVMGLLKVGDEAPDLSGTDQNGEKVSLAELRGHSSAVVFFYPKDGSPVCTAEVCAFRDSYERFSEIGAVVIGISGDTKDSHKQFAETHSLPFHLLSDTDGKLRKQFGVARVLGLLPGRETYVIDKEGIVRLAFSAQFASDQHVKQAVEALDTD